ncbi:MAG TPA: AarF/ABC1/UbiB kinase family protein [Atribacteraceae bacterium]|nr:AarF/ABC1/UbiB kinase family protein [Atribacteraceae bacterium]
MSVFYPRIRNFKRFREIMRVMSRYGFRLLFRRYHLFEQVRLYPQRKTRLNPPQVNLRLALEELGATFIKLGQILSTRIDLLPEEYCRELKKLQDKAPPVDFSQIREVIEKELGHPLADVFSNLDPVPLASASIAQVHQGTLKDGRKVAVKVQKPKVEEQVHADLEILSYLTALAGRLHIIPESFSATEIYHEFRKIILREIDFLYEAINAKKFKENFSGFPEVYIPEVYRDYTTRRVLMLELIEGERISRMSLCQLGDIDCHALACRGVEAVLKMIFNDGFFHADPHPGNVMIKKTGELVFLDFGMVGTVDRETRENMVRLLLAALEKDSSRVVSILEEGFLLTSVKSPFILRVEFNEVLERYITADLRELSLRNLVNDFFYIFQKHRLRFPVNLSAMLRALVVAEGTGMSLDPGFTIAPYLEKFLKKVLIHFMSFDNLTKQAKNYALDWQILLQEFPEKAHDILTQLASGRFNVHFEIKDIDNINRRLEITGTRLSLSIILGSLLIGSSLIYTNFPYLRVLSILGMFGYVVAAGLGIILLVELFRHR